MSMSTMSYISTPVKEKDFKLSSLWPKSNNNWMAPKALNSITAAYGVKSDLGNLRVNNGVWEIHMNRTPTQDNQSSSEWVLFDPSNKQHMLAANAFNRYGPGWSYGPGHNQHMEVVWYYEEVYGTKPDRMTQMDIEHNKGLWEDLKKKYNEKMGFVPGKEEPKKEPDKPVDKPTDKQPTDKPVVPAVDPIGPDAGALFLSSPETRTDEILSLIPFRDMWMPRFAIEALPKIVLELIKSRRRMEDRIVSRVVAALKK
jgi:hypothetical protein